MRARMRSEYTLARLGVREAPHVAWSREPRRGSLLPFVLMLLAVGTLCVLCLPAIAGAQTRDAVADEIEKTDRVIEKARELLAETDRHHGRFGLEMAERLQNQAKMSLSSGQLRMALNLTLQARELALSSVANRRPAEDNEAAVERELERTDRVLEEVAERLADGTLRARRLEQARAMQHRAWELFRNRSLRPALKLTIEARELAAGMAMHGPGGPGRDFREGGRGDRHLERLEMALDRLSENIGPDNPRGLAELESARNSYRDALNAIHEGRPLQAERHLRLAREAMMRAALTIEASLRAEDVEALIGDARRRWESLGEDVEEAGNESLRDRHAEAGADLNLAEDAWRRGELRRALVQARSAIGLLDRIADELEY